jgi:trafficking protein particle complex subunit 3
MSKQSRTNTNPIDSRKISYELFNLTYGAFVAQLIQDYENISDVNKQLDQIGYNMGIRMIEDFLSRTPSIGRCSDFRETSEVLSKQAFKMFLGIQPTVTNWNATFDEFSLVIDPNPLTEFVELPDDSKLDNLRYSQIICGVIRGALEMVQLKVECFIKSEPLKGESGTEIRVKYIEVISDAIPIGED